MLSFVLMLLALVTIDVRSQVSAAESYRIVPIRAMTEDVEVLYGDPEKSGEPFVIRIRELAGGLIPPHRHPVDEHITVVQGTVYFAIGDKFDRAVMKEMKMGSYAFIPKGSIMFGYTPDAAIVQVHGVGPFHIHWRAGEHWQDELKTLDSPDARAVFKYKRGDSVVTPRGKGRIRQGYDSGEVIGYEIDGENGALFIAEECEIAEVNGKRADEADRRGKCFSRGTGSSGLKREERHTHQ
jgi:quercetin dioxygenase-like cupin family protein